MNEETKHIESCRAEDVLSQSMELAATEDIAQAALQPLLVETMPGYVPVATTAPTSPIAELPGVLISIIRSVATKPLTILGERPAKQSLLGTLLDTWNAIRQRLSGNPSLGIPDRTTEMTAHSLPTALALLSDRKITNGSATADGIPDGTTMVHILGDSSMQITELGDDNADYTMNRQLNLSLFPSASKVTIAAKRIEFADQGTQVINSTAVKDVEIPNAEYVKGSFSSIALDAKVNAPKMTSCFVGYGGGPNCEEVLMPSLRDPNGTSIFRWWQTDSPLVMKHMVIGSLRSGGITNWSNGKADDLLDFEVGADGLGGVSMNFNISWWTATNVLADATFLQNFREHIALRLANRKDTTALTLTLSQAVFSAVIEGSSPICDDIKGIIEDKGWKVQDTNNNIFPTT